MAENQEIDLSVLREQAQLGIVKEFPFEQINANENNRIYQGDNKTIYKSKLYGQDVAIKVLERNDQIINSLEGIKNHAILNHPNILILYGYCFHENKLYLVSPFQSKGSLEKIITKINQIQNDQEKERVILDILIDMAKGIQYLHSKEIIHRDLNPGNILLDSNFNAKICDFDFSVKFNKNSPFTVITENYHAPELNQSTPLNSEKIDIYSFGKIAYFLFNNIIPIDYIFLIDCLNANPEERPSAQQILNNLSLVKRRKFGKIEFIPQKKIKKEKDTSNKLLDLFYDFIQFAFILQFILVMIYLDWNEKSVSKYEMKLQAI